MDQSGAGPSPVAAAATAAAAAALTPQRGYLPGRRPDASPYSSSPVVTTPEQLKGFLVRPCLSCQGSGLEIWVQGSEQPGG